MKTLIKVIIFLFLTTVMCLYIFIPAVVLGMKTELSWYTVWLVLSNCIVGVAILVIPLIYIFNWIDKKIKP